MENLQAPFLQRLSSRDYNTNLLSLAWARRGINKNGEPYFVVRFSYMHTYQITPNKYWKETVKKYNTMWDDNIVVTEEVKKFRRAYTGIQNIPRYQMWKIWNKSFRKVSWLSEQIDKNGNMYYFIPKTKMIPFKTDTRFMLKKDYYIFHQDINKNKTLKNKARLWYSASPLLFKP